MSRSSSSTEIQAPVALSDAVTEQKEQHYDCLPCRLTGSAAFTGLGIYTYWSGQKQLREREREILRSGSRFGIGARKVGVFGMSAALVGVGVFRLLY